ncbi:DUF6509 family protein [Paenibacillus urinalis]|uniref:DUF6509 family protein n=1 Tax=Paenibacillus urinalis TaxID=521520 RepID=A0AAX3MWL2_9BACL|nr:MULTISPECIES: DUF6509 family protein [Paenibacillus]WDH81662.1 DUF6509 family protein [Paenibacillus urinalis]WDH97708.1 DUF6509 family protein [Paenibacillus urinalis]WDI01383.1 DUF6509 family protein [Paenibacillus urinalis]GAK42162.1 hypothetical protein TCA2_4654 [Paenibacillus sp. TCA20]
MLEMSSYRFEEIKDPFGILAGTRYEFHIDLDVEEDDELYSENGVYIRVIYRTSDTDSSIVKYELYESVTDRYLDFDLEEDELASLDAFCKEKLAEI